MKRRRRQSDTSEVALMAVMTKAMGAFLILMVFAMQYYIPDFTAEQIAAIVNRSIGGVRAELAGVVDRMKKGDFTKQDLEALQRQIEVSLAKLAQAEGDIARLQTRLDQSVSQLKRVEAERARLESEAQALKEEVARLRAFDPAVLQVKIAALQEQLKTWEDAAAVFFELRYHDCGDAIIDLRVSRRLPDGSSVASLVPQSGAQPFDPISRGPLRESGYDDYARWFADRDPAVGLTFSSAWNARRVRRGEVLAVYAAYLNAETRSAANNSDGPSLNRSYCAAEFRALATNSGTISASAQIGSSNPFSLLAVIKATENGLVQQQLSADEQRWFQQRIDNAPCDSLTCAPDSVVYRKEVAKKLSFMYRLRLDTAPSQQQATNPEATNRLIDDLTGRFATGSISQSQLTDYAALLTPPKSGNSAGAAPSADTLDAARGRLTAAALPPPLTQEFLARASRGWWSADELERRIQRVEKQPTPASTRNAPATAENPGRMIALLRSMSETGVMTAGVASQWIGLVMQPPSPGTAAPPATVKRDDLVAQMSSKGFPPEFASFIANRVTAGTIKLDDYASAMKATKGNASR